MECKFCTKCINSIGSLVAHENVCTYNPDRVTYGRNPNAIKKLGSHPKWRKLYPNELMFSENCKIARHSVKRRILEDCLIDYVCACCSVGAVWNNKPLVLILDHINGVNNDNRLENLRFVCSNCDSQLDTYKSRNKGKVGREADCASLEN